MPEEMSLPARNPVSREQQQREIPMIRKKILSGRVHSAKHPKLTYER